LIPGKRIPGGDFEYSRPSRHTQGLTIHIDYRDGLVKLDFDPKRAGAFSH
jgi:hypothetical protein